MRSKHFILCLFIIMTSGCSSIICGDEETIIVSSNPSKAQFEITSNGKIFAQGLTPDQITLKRGGGWFKTGNYVASFQKEGYQNTKMQIPQKLEAGWYLGGNIVFGGFIGWLIVDPLTGAMWTIEDVEVFLKPLLE